MTARFSARAQTGLGAHAAFSTMGTGSFPGVKRPGRGVDYPPQSSAEVKETVQLIFTVVPCILMLSNLLLVQLMHSLILHCASIHTQNRAGLIYGHTTEQFNNEVY